MRQIIGVIRREVGEKALAFPAALLLGGIPFLIAAVRKSAGAADVRNLAAGFLALLAGSALAVTFGFWSTAGDIGSRRMAFYLARPVSAFGLWAGKAIGDLLVVLGSVALTLLPVFVAGGRLRTTQIVPVDRGLEAVVPERFTPAGMVGIALLAFVALFLLSQAAGVAILARSAWLVPDVLLAAVAGALLLSSARTLLASRAEAALTRGGAALVGGILMAAAVGGYQAFRQGRTNLRRAARAQSTAFWSIVAGLVALSVAGVAWVVGATPSDLRTVDWVVPSARGDWIAMSGRARWRGGYSPVFFENVRTGAFLRVRPFFESRFPVIAPDGRRAAWTSAGPAFGEWTLTPHTVLLGEARSERVAWETKDLHDDPLLTFSPDSRRFAVTTSDRITVWDTSRGAMLVSAKPPFPLWEHARGFTFATFAGPDVLRVYSIRLVGDGSKRSRLDILELDVVARRLRQTGTAGPFAHTFPIFTDGSHRKLLLRDGPASILLLDAKTGATLTTISDGGALSRSADFLADGRVAVFESRNGAGRIAVLSIAGERTKEISVGPAERAYIVGESRPGFLMIVAGSKADLVGRNGRVVVVDLARGSAEEWAKHLTPAAPYARFIAGDPGDMPAPGSLATRLFFTPEGALVELEGPNRIRRLLPKH